ncbi:4939_t:CDS:10 [Acaulospora colombiana]|uniref:4939_t:CDS:1 n=1 Tax=Acaulospora colombiana TaxID=27376 RepID=A0ACA9JYY2_9GLOM|nr:4939_t:CDS:10 [Acaulospora colombiana]
MANYLLTLLSNDYVRLFECEDYADVIIRVGEGSDVKSFRAHSLILRTRSSYFRTELQNYRTNSLLVFNQPNIPVRIFEILLRYLYTGRLDIINNNIPDTLSVLSAANKLGFSDLCSYIQDYLLAFKKDLLKQHFTLLYGVAKEFESLSAFCIELINQDPKIIFHNESFTYFEKEELLHFCENFSSLIDPIKLWDKILEWANFQLETMGKNQVTTLKELINPLVSYIDFKQVKREDFFQKVRPFRSIFNDDDYIQILEYVLRSDLPQSSQPQHAIGIHTIPSPNIEPLLPPPAPLNMDSILITPIYFKIISGWINELGRSGQNDHRFSLLLRGSYHGFSSRVFHDLCDFKNATLTICKIKNTNEIIGGFNPVDWTSSPAPGKYSNTKRSFIFSLDLNNINKSVLSRVVDDKHAIFQHRDFGPSFGLKSDLKLYSMNNKLCCCVKTSYEKPIRSSKSEFALDDYEVWRDRECDGIVATLSGHGDRVNCVSFIDRGDGLHQKSVAIISGSVDKTARIWKKNQNGKWVNSAILEPHGGSVNTIGVIRAKSIIVNKDLVVTGSAEGALKVWERTIIDDAKVDCIQTIDLESKYPLALALSYFPDSKVPILAIGCTDKKILIYAQKDRQFIKSLSLQGHENWVRSLSFAVYTSSGDVPDLQKSNILQQHKLKDGDLLLASASQDKYVRLWKISYNGEILKSKSLDGDDMDEIKNNEVEKRSNTTVTEKSSVKELLENLQDDAIQKVQLSTKAHVIDIETDNASIKLGWVELVEMLWVFFGGLFGPNGNYIIAHGHTGAFHLWKEEENQNWQPQVSISGHFNSVQDIEWDPTLKYLVSVSLDQTARLFAPWNRLIDGTSVTTWHEIGRPQIHGYDIYCLAFVDKWRVISGADEKVKIWRQTDDTSQNTTQWRCISTIKLSEAVTAIDFAPRFITESYCIAVGLENGKLLLFKSEDAKLENWSLALDVGKE